MFACMCICICILYIYINIWADQGLLACTVACLEEVASGTEDKTNMEWLLWQESCYSKRRAQNESVLPDGLKKGNLWGGEKEKYTGRKAQGERKNKQLLPDTKQQLKDSVCFGDREEENSKQRRLGCLWYSWEYLGIRRITTISVIEMAAVTVYSLQ